MQSRSERCRPAQPKSGSTQCDTRATIVYCFSLRNPFLLGAVLELLRLEEALEFRLLLHDESRVAAREVIGQLVVLASSRLEFIVPAKLLIQRPNAVGVLALRLHDESQCNQLRVHMGVSRVEAQKAFLCLVV